MKKRRFFVYALLDPRKGGNFTYQDLTFLFEPYYIGKGSGRRIHGHFTDHSLKNNTNLIKNSKIRKIIQSGYNPKNYVVIIKNQLTEKQAYKLENKYIKLIGQLVNNTGVLTNLVDDVSQISTYRRKFTSSLKGKTYEEIHGEDRAKLLKQIRSTQCSGKNNPMFGKRSSRKGQTLSQEQRLKISQSKTQPILQIHQFTGKIICEWSSVREAADTLNLSYSGIGNALAPNMKTRTCGGYIWQYKHKYQPCQPRQTQFWIQRNIQDHNVVAIFTNLQQIKLQLKCDSSRIASAVKYNNGILNDFIWTKELAFIDEKMAYFENWTWPLSPNLRAEFFA